MKTLKHFLFIALAMIATFGLASCQSDDEIGFDIAGLYGVSWEGDMGFNADNGEALYNVLTFQSGSSNTHGIGYDDEYYQSDDAFYNTYKFDWEVVRGDLYLYYNNGETHVFHDIASSSNRFTARIDNDNDRTIFKFLAESRNKKKR